MTTARHRLEYAAYSAMMGSIGNLPLDASTGSAAGAARVLGKGLFRPRAERNLRFAMPELDAKARDPILDEMFECFARTALEYRHLRRMIEEEDRIRVDGVEHLLAAREAGKGAVIVTGHLGNWEPIRIAAYRAGWPMALIYRAFNNPLFDADARRMMQVLDAPVLHKGRRGAMGLLRHVRAGGVAMILVDQRFTKAPLIPFFGHPALTAVSAAEIAQGFGAKLLMARGIRRGRSSLFSVSFTPPLEVADRTPVEVMGEVNDRLEAWVRETPGQYFWLHNRWGRKALKEAGLL